MLNIILTALVSLTVANAAFGRGKPSHNLSVLRQYRPIHFNASLPVLAVIVGVAALLYTYVPFMDKNPILWALWALFGWGTGDGQANLLLFGLQWKYYSVVFLPLMLLALPSLARFEEEHFRRGTQNWADGLLRSILFGFAHLIMLIPLAAAVALIISGLWFTHQYFKGGVERSTVYHSAYNSIIIAYLFGILLMNF